MSELLEWAAKRRLSGPVEGGVAVGNQ